MSAFDDDNPFSDKPFEDPSIKQVTQNTANAARDLEIDYNPFDENNQNQRPTTVPLSNSTDDSAVRGAANPPINYGSSDSTRSPAVMSPSSNDVPPSFNNHQQHQQGQPISTAELQRRQEELEKKARELELREAELRNTPFNARKNNWPPLPSFIPCQPCFYQDINVDIPVEFQRIVRYIYYIWALHTLVLFINSIVFLLRVFFIHESKDFVGLLLSLVYIAIFTPSSYICWFRPAYKAFRNDSSFNFMVFFFVFFFQFIFSILLCLGLMEGSNGFVYGISLMGNGGASNIAIGIFILLVGICFATCSALDFYMLVRVHGIYRSSGASIDKARQEFTTGFMRNEHVQGAASGIASEAINQGIRSTFSNNSNSNAPRY